MAIAHGVGCIMPPHMLESIADRGTDRQKEMAVATLELGARIRAQRGEIGMPAAAPGAARDRTIYTAEHSTDLPGTPVRREGDRPTQHPVVDEAYDGAGATYDMFLEVYGRRSLDDDHLPLLSTVHYGVGFGNALWDGQQMVYGDGDSDLPPGERLFNRFTASLEVIAHELTHGVTAFSANLAYEGQSGALNESFSDVFGSLVKQWRLNQSVDQADWLIGSELLTANVNAVAIRSMKNPGSAYDDPVLGRDPQPGHMSDYVDTSSDNGGVHINSGIPSHAFFQTAMELGGNAWEKAGLIWYKTLTGGQLSSTAQFQACADLTYAVAGTEFGDGSLEQQAVKTGWSKVGIDVPGGSTPTPGRGWTPRRDRAPAPSPDPAPPASRAPALEPAPYLDENVQFTVYRPERLPPEEWRPLLAFAHLSEKPAEAPETDPDPVEEVQRQARQLLGDEAEEYASTVQDSRHAIARDSDLTFVPVVEGVQFNPERHTFTWTEPVHRAEFRMRASREVDGRTVRGSLTVFRGSIIFADVPLKVLVTSEASSDPFLATASSSPYRRVFPSYSHADTSVIEIFEAYGGAAGDEFLRDVTALRSGEVWNDRLREMIRDADVFQLFWSSNSLRSRYVEEEYRYALSLGRPSFVRPVYWESPLPTTLDPVRPPPELARLHFYRIPAGPVEAPARPVQPPSLAPSTPGGPQPGPPPVRTPAPARPRDKGEPVETAPPAPGEGAGCLPLLGLMAAASVWLVPSVLDLVSALLG